MEGKKILILGANGFIGKSLLLNLIENKNKVTACFRNDNNILNIESEYLEKIKIQGKDYKNISKIVKTRNFDYCFYLTWLGTEGKNRMDFTNQVLNIDYFLEFLGEALNLNVKKVIFISSDRKANYLKEKKGEIVDSPYGKVKEACEMLGANFCYKNNIDFNSVVFSNVYGVNDKSKRSTNLILLKLIKNEDIDLISENEIYDWTYIDDAIKRLLIVAKSGENYETYYCGSNKISTFGEIIKQAKSILNSKSKLNFGAYKNNYRVYYEFLDISKFKREFGEIEETPFSEAIKKTAKWLKNVEL